MLVQTCLIVFSNKRSEVVQELRKLESATEPIVKIMEDPDVTKHIQSSRDGRQLFDTLAREYDVSQPVCLSTISLCISDAPNVE